MFLPWAYAVGLTDNVKFKKINYILNLIFCLLATIPYVLISNKMGALKEGFNLFFYFSSIGFGLLGIIAPFTLKDENKFLMTGFCSCVTCITYLIYLFIK
jgi:hypothetical protein